MAGTTHIFFIGSYLSFPRWRKNEGWSSSGCWLIWGAIYFRGLLPLRWFLAHGALFRIIINRSVVMIGRSAKSAASWKNENENELQCSICVVIPVRCIAISFSLNAKRRWKNWWQMSFQMRREIQQLGKLWYCFKGLTMAILAYLATAMLSRTQGAFLPDQTVLAALYIAHESSSVTTRQL